jgi:hypothetical protein
VSRCGTKISIDKNGENIQVIEDSVNMLAYELDRGVSIYGDCISLSINIAGQQKLTFILSQE